MRKQTTKEIRTGIIGWCIADFIYIIFMSTGGFSLPFSLSVFLYDFGTADVLAMIFFGFAGYGTLIAMSQAQR